MRVLLERLAIGLLLLLIAVYAGDGFVFRYRSAHGGGYDSVTVKQFMEYPLKNGKEEMDFTGTQSMRCARSLFPWGGTRPCWWLRRHPENISKL